MDFIKNNLYKLIGALLVIIAVFLLFAPSVSFELKVGSSTIVAEYSGFQAIFGYSVSKEVVGQTVTTTYLNFSAGNFIAFLLLVLGAIAAVVFAFVKVPYSNFIAGGVIVVAAIMLFLMGVMVSGAEIYKNYDVVLKAGAIVAGILAILGGGVIAAEPYLPKLIK